MQSVTDQLILLAESEGSTILFDRKKTVLPQLQATAEHGTVSGRGSVVAMTLWVELVSF